MESLFENTLVLKPKTFTARLKLLWAKHPFLFCWGAFGILYFLSHHWLGHLKPVHFLFWGFVLALYSLHLRSRLFVFLALPFILKEILFDYLRYVPFEWLSSVHVTQPYQIEQFLFGFYWNGTLLLPHELLGLYQNSILDVLCGSIYLVHAPIAILMLILIWKNRSAALARRYAIAFLLMNLMAFATYLAYPAAAPWYVSKYGFTQPLVSVAGDPAGLAYFDALIGFPLATRIYGASPVVFGAIPSMHAGFVSLGWLYALKMTKKYSIPIGFYVLWMCFAAVYLQHHYVIDLVLGVFYAWIAYLLVEKRATQSLLMKRSVPKSTEV